MIALTWVIDVPLATNMAAIRATAESTGESLEASPGLLAGITAMTVAGEAGAPRNTVAMLTVWANTSRMAEFLWGDATAEVEARLARPTAHMWPVSSVQLDRSRFPNITHAGLHNFCVEQRERYRPGPDSRILHVSSPSFDASMLELLLALGASSTTVISPAGVFGGAELAELIRRERVSHAFITPSVLASMDPSGLDSLQHLAAGGEAVPADAVARWSPGRSLYNGYGPTETTIMANISEPMVPGAITPLAFSIGDKYHTFKKGHRLMVQIQSSWFPMFDRNPQTFVDIYHAADSDYQRATHRVYRSRQQPSFLSLPVLASATSTQP